MIRPFAIRILVFHTEKYQNRRTGIDCSVNMDGLAASPQKKKLTRRLHTEMQLYKGSWLSSKQSVDRALILC